MACRQTTESLIPRVEQVAESFGWPAPEGDVKEKLGTILQGLTTLAQRGRVTRLLNSAEDVNRLGGITEDIRDAVMDYWVCPQNPCSHPG